MYVCCFAIAVIYLCAWMYFIVGSRQFCIAVSCSLQVWAPVHQVQFCTDKWFAVLSVTSSTTSWPKFVNLLAQNLTALQPQEHGSECLEGERVRSLLVLYTVQFLKSGHIGSVKSRRGCCHGKTCMRFTTSRPKKKESAVFFNKFKYVFVFFGTSNPDTPFYSNIFPDTMYVLGSNFIIHWSKLCDV